MGKLGDFFPDEEKQQYADRQLKPGQVVFIFSGFTNPPKEKYLVIGHLGEKPLLFVINSKVHPYIQSHPDLLQCQVLITASDHCFLEHDSYVDCSQVIDSVAEAEIRTQVLADLGRIRGELNANTKQQIIQVVRGARTIPERYKTLIINSLK